MQKQRLEDVKVQMIDLVRRKFEPSKSLETGSNRHRSRFESPNGRSLGIKDQEPDSRGNALG
jgi:hypothetical protein